MTECRVVLPVLKYPLQKNLRQKQAVMRYVILSRRHLALFLQTTSATHRHGIL